MISFLGHGKVLMGQMDHVHQFQIHGNEFFDLQNLETKLARKYQAPVWLLLDFCRMNQPGKHDPNMPNAAIHQKLAPRDFDKFNALARADQEIVAAIEKLRGNVSAGFRHREGGITKLAAARVGQGAIPEPKYLLHENIGNLLEQTALPDGKQGLQFGKVDKKVKAQAHSLTLSEVFACVEKQFEAAKIAPATQKPCHLPGLFSDQMVVFSTLRGADSPYQPQHPSLLLAGLSRSLDDRGKFDVPQLYDKVRHGPITVIRNQPKLYNDFGAMFRFTEPFELAKRVKYQIVLAVSASGGTNKDAIGFITGVHGENGGEYLNDCFATMYANAESAKTPVVCDGKIRLIHVPLKLFNAEKIESNKVVGFEVQAYPINPESSWKQNLALSIHGVYLVDIATPDDHILNDLALALTELPLQKMLFWDLPLHDKPMSVKVSPQEMAIKLSQSVHNHEDLWGVGAEIYPKLFIEKSTRQLHFTLKVAEGQMIDKKAEVYCCVYSHRRFP